MKIHLVNITNIGQYAVEIEAMHRDRKRVFVDRLKWAELATDSPLEIDEFDNAYCSYFLLLDDENRLLGSCRLTPTDKPNVTTNKLQNFFSDNPPISSSVYEVSRWIPAPGIKELNAKCNYTMILGLFEFGQSLKLSRLICCAGRIVSSAIARAGVPVDKMHPPQRFAEGVAFGIECVPNEENLEILRASFGMARPVIEFHKHRNDQPQVYKIPAFMGNRIDADAHISSNT